MVKTHEARHHLHHPNISRHLVSAAGDTFDYNFNPLLGIGISFVLVGIRVLILLIQH